MNKKGFTIVELLMALAFFSFILMFVVAGFIQINRSYTRGVTVRRVQQGTRAVIEEVTRVMRTASSVRTIYDHDNGYRICFGGVRFGWNQHRAGSATPDYSDETYGSERINFIKSYDALPCENDFPPSSVSDSVSSPLDANVQIQFLSLEEVGNGSQTKAYKLKIVASSFENNDLESYGEDARCKVRVGDQFCDVAELETVVTLRN